MASEPDPDRLRALEVTPPFCALLLGLDIDLKKMGLAPALHIHTSTYDTEQHFKNLKAGCWMSTRRILSSGFSWQT